MKAASESVASLRQAAERAEPELVEQLLRLTAIDAPSGDLEALAGAADAFGAELEELGCGVEEHRNDGITHLSARIGRADGRHVLALCHYDTVWPAGTAGERPGRLQNGRLSGPGTFDMRGGITALLGALAIVGAGGLPLPLQLLLTGDEETGSASSRELIEELARDAALVLVTEPPLPGGALKTARKGWGAYTVFVSGRAAHAGLDPDSGVSAIDELMDVLRQVTDLRRPDSGTTVNVGTIRGGTRPNVIAADASADFEVRATTIAGQQRADEALQALHATREGARVSVAQHHSRPPMERTPAVAVAAAAARELAGELGFDLSEGAAGGTSDANLVAPLGVPVLDGLGPEGDGAHALHEHVLVDSLVERTALLAAILTYALSPTAPRTGEGLPAPGWSRRPAGGSPRSR
ncbi:MAG TPA: M20 family metallopeptidase [Thermoleophilaceae bacterium]